jgi:uncharacterized membrane protein YkgB
MIFGSSSPIMDTKQRIEYYLQRLSEKHFQIYDVRVELEQQKVPEEEIKTIVRAVDEELQKQLLAKNQRDSAADIIRIGIIFMIIGVLIAITTWTGIISLGSMFFLTYGLFIGGLSMVLVGWVKRKKKQAQRSVEQQGNNSDKREISFRRRRE